MHNELGGKCGRLYFNRNDGNVCEGGDWIQLVQGLFVSFVFNLATFATQLS